MSLTRISDIVIFGFKDLTPRRRLDVLGAALKAAACINNNNDDNINSNYADENGGVSVNDNRHAAAAAAVDDDQTRTHSLSSDSSNSESENRKLRLVHFELRYSISPNSLPVGSSEFRSGRELRR